MTVLSKVCEVSLGLASLALVASTPGWADDNLRINGFLTAGVTGSDMKSMPTCPSTGYSGAMRPSSNCTVVTSPTNPLQYTPYYDHIGGTPSWSQDGILGLQTDYTIDSRSSVTAQLVSYGTQDYQVEDAWAYATFKPTSNVQLRMGRQRIPFYMLSEQLDVGMSYPWARPPVEMYANPVNTYDGISGKYSWMLGDVSGDFGFIAGDAPATHNSPYIPLGFDIKNVRGFNFNVYTGNFTFHGGVNAGNVNLNLADDQTPGKMFYNLNQLLTTVGNPGISDQLATFYNLGMIYDDGSLLVMSEVADLQYSQGILQDPFRGYVLLGYHMGDFLPNFTYSTTRTNTAGNSRRSQALGELNNPANTSTLQSYAASQYGLSQIGVANAINASNLAQQSIANQGMQQSSYTLGLRYDITPKMSAKLEWSYVTGLGSNSGGFGGGGWGMFSDAPLNGHADIYTFVINAMF
ncbi:MAG: hypothetical protein HKM02_03750 [Pseudomonadales bacterium]|nr:hypothetical protein [Pseudomonadales bacterium]